MSGIFIGLIVCKNFNNINCMCPYLTKVFLELFSLYKVSPGDCLLENFHPMRLYLISLEALM